MTTSSSESRLVRFADLELDLQTGELWRHGKRSVLPPQLFRLLAMLVEAHGSLVTREELRQELWADTTFGDFENGLNAAVKRLREALGDSATAPRFIETIPRRGYRFIAALEDHETGHDDHLPWYRHWRVVAMAGFALLVAITSIAFVFLSQSRDDPAVHHELVRLTSTSGLNIDPAFSPDGSLLAFASDREGATGLDIWVQPIGGGNATRITSEEGDEAEPSFSPDGRSIVYAKRERGGIFIVSASGGDSRVLVQGARAWTPRFSPDGRFVLYWTGNPVFSPPVDAGEAFATSSLEVVSAGGGRPRSIAADFASARFGIWSPDGRHILFLGERERGETTDSLDWYFASTDGGAPVRTFALAALKAAGVSGVPVPEDWRSRDGTVVFASTGEGASNVWQVRISAATGAIVGKPQRLTFGTAIERSPAAAPSRIAFTSLTENVDVWRVALDRKSGLAAGPLQRITDNAAPDRLVNVSDDGRFLVFMSSRSGRDTPWIRNLDSGSEKELTHRGVFNARISRDGSVVALNVNEPRPQSMAVGAQGEPPMLLCDDCRLVDWSPDGRTLSERGTPRALFMRDTKSGRETPLARHPTWNLYQGRFSPDGRWVAFHTTNAPALRQIFVVPARSDEVALEEWIPVVIDFGIRPSWSPDGHGIYYFSLRDGSFCAWLQPLDRHTMRPSGAPMVVQHLHQPRLRASTSASVSSDVRAGYLYMTLTEVTANLWTITTDRSGEP